MVTPKGAPERPRANHPPLYAYMIVRGARAYNKK